MYRSIRKTIQRLMRSLLRTWIRMNRRDRYGRAGFVLPTVVMVLLVVVLLTIAITLRSFDRAKVAQYRRVDEAVLQAATPALDRARAKLEDLLGGGDESRKVGLSSRGIPSELSLYTALGDDSLYNFPDEERLTVKFEIPDPDIDDKQCDSTNVDDCNQMNTAWRFPVDTDNNGQYDSLTYYGIFFRTPPIGPDGETRARVPLDARTPPVDTGNLSDVCAAAEGTSASLLGEKGWVKTSGLLKKSFFIYTVTVPITEDDPRPNIPGNYENFKGTPGFSALELQQDYGREPIVNNAVIYEDDLDLSPGTEFNLNGRIITNSNFIVTPLRNDRDVKLYLVSSPASCFYTADNSKIQVAGNVVVGAINRGDARPIEVHLFDPGLEAGQEPQKKDLTKENDSVSNDPQDVLYNSLAYEKRIQALVTADPSKLADDYREMTRKVPFKEVAIDKTDTATATVQDYNGEKGPNLEAMLPVNDQGLSANTTLGLEKDNLPAKEPIDDNNQKEEYIGDRILVGNNLPWRYFFNGKWQESRNDDPMTIEGGKWAGNVDGRYRKSQVADIPNTGQTARDGDWEKDAVRDPEKPEDGVGGVLIVTGAGVYNRQKSFLPPPVPATMNVDEVDGVYKPVASGGEPFTVVWPDTMPMSPPYDQNGDPIPGSKIYDNSGLYDDDGWTPEDDFLNLVQTPTWRDTPDWIPPLDPLAADDPNPKGDLRMRTTIVYHYASAAEEGINDNLKVDIAGEPTSLGREALVPYACVSSYYDPSSSFTAKNESGLPWNASAIAINTGRSNNGIVYKLYESPPSWDDTALDKQAKLIYPDGRLVNEALYRASEKGYTSSELTLEEHAAVYSAQCSLDILNGTATPVTSDDVGDPLTRTTQLYTSIPDGAIREATLLDARQAKAFDQNLTRTVADETFSLRVNPDGTVADAADPPPELEEKYRQPLENRYPLEVRVTQLDLNALRNTTVTQNLPEDKGPTVNGTEYLLPLSGIVYATRDDALPDFTNETVEQSAADYKIDPTRRPNGIMLINGERLARNDADDDGQNDKTDPTQEEVVNEKGLILASNVPVYIWGNFNLHTHEEFDDKLFPQDQQPNWDDFYDRKELDPLFACRKGDPRLPACKDANDTDDWRQATVLADAVTLLTRNDGNLKEGFRFGFRNEGDFDLRNNAGNVVIGGGYNFNSTNNTLTDSVTENAVGLDLDEDGVIETDPIPETQITAKMARLLAGFNPYNDYVVNGLSSGLPFDTNEDGTFNTGNEPNELYNDEDYRVNDENPANSSYFNNFVTPIQRRRNFSEYVMEICLKLPVSACQPGDWVVIDKDDPDPNNRKTASQALADGDGIDDIDGSGTTARPPAPDYQRFPRRVAFKRDASYNLDSTTPTPLGIAGGDIVDTTPDKTDNALWFQTRKGTGNTTKDWGSNHPLWYYKPGPTSTDRNTARTTFTPNTQQPLLVPVLQIQTGQGNESDHTKPDIPNFPSTKDVDEESYWLQGSSRAGGTFNLIVGTGDTPPRPGEINGGLNNLPRTLENFFSGQKSSSRESLNIVGSFVQTGRSRYATAPYQAMTSDAGQRHPAMFGNTDSNRGRVYRINTTDGRTPFLVPPNRNWGFDVGLLSQPTDRYASKFTQASPEIDDYFREVSRDDPWVKALLCSKAGGNPALARNGNRVKLTGTDCSDYGG
ncbi:hormogonium polysaccharide biosynthesis protein HpsA [Capilliphycus salinus ALCB114379]|uniref:hormogonium polysaccharide biosynthesis protein HpsA n=1 Tax=Capilliphycus salinus TaxID=2768948 RepID=UPI0039A75FE9